MSNGYALISVTDKDGISDFAKGLQELGYGILSTGGTAKQLRESGVTVTDVSEYTGHPEILDGRVKTLHPKIHGGILMDRGCESHIKEAKQCGLRSIDIVVSNLYDFKKNAIDKRLSMSEAINFIDIGGPTLLRAAAKNYRFCLPVISPRDYSKTLELLKTGDITENDRIRYSAKVFDSINAYDKQIGDYFNKNTETKQESDASGFIELRYGENPHQTAQFMPDQSKQPWRQLQGKMLSYNNYLDLNAAFQIAVEFKGTDKKVCAILKHTNPCGVAVDPHLSANELFRKALACDPVSAFGSIIVFNQEIDESAAKTITEDLFVECIIATSFTDSAIACLAKKKNLRLLVSDFEIDSNKMQIRTIVGGRLSQSIDI